MPLYEFRCAAGGTFERNFPMGQVPAEVQCPDCGAEARKLLSPPRLSRMNSRAYGVIDATRRSAHEPAIVQGTLPAAGRQRAPSVTTNPLHRKLPRP